MDIKSYMDSCSLNDFGWVYISVRIYTSDFILFNKKLIMKDKLFGFYAEVSTLVLIVLKLIGVIACSWWWVFSPMIVMIILVLIMVIFFFIFLNFF